MICVMGSESLKLMIQALITSRDSNAHVDLFADDEPGENGMIPAMRADEGHVEHPAHPDTVEPVHNWG